MVSGIKTALAMALRLRIPSGEVVVRVDTSEETAVFIMGWQESAVVVALLLILVERSPPRRPMGGEGLRWLQLRFELE
jgi:hypothetical protein